MKKLLIITFLLIIGSGIKAQSRLDSLPVIELDSSYNFDMSWVFKKPYPVIKPRMPEANTGIHYADTMTYVIFKGDIIMRMNNDTFIIDKKVIQKLTPLIVPCNGGNNNTIEIVLYKKESPPDRKDTFNIR